MLCSLNFKRLIGLKLNYLNLDKIVLNLNNNPLLFFRHKIISISLSV